MGIKLTTCVIYSHTLVLNYNIIKWFVATLIVNFFFFNFYIFFKKTSNLFLFVWPMKNSLTHTTPAQTHVVGAPVSARGDHLATIIAAPSPARSGVSHPHAHLQLESAYFVSCHFTCLFICKSCLNCFCNFKINILN